MCAVINQQQLNLDTSGPEKEFLDRLCFGHLVVLIVPESVF